jgi:hypothetical protein
MARAATAIEKLAAVADHWKAELTSCLAERDRLQQVRHLSLQPTGSV